MIGLVAWSYPVNNYERWEDKLNLMSCALSTGQQLCLLSVGCSSVIVCIFLIKKTKQNQNPTKPTNQPNKETKQEDGQAAKHL